MGGGWCLCLCVCVYVCARVRVHVHVRAVPCGLGRELGLGGLQPRAERLPGGLVRVVRAQQEADALRVVRDGVERIVVRAELGFFYALRGRGILTDLWEDAWC